MAKRRAPQEFILDITAVNDGIVTVREAQEWTKNKLGILWAYLRQYARACRTAGQFHFVDGMAGPGLYRFSDSGVFLLGSTLIALKVADPPFTRCLAMDIDGRNVSALRQRADQYGERAVVLEGDCNRDLLAAVQKNIPDDFPIFFLFDPEGAELDWRTIEAAARFRRGALKSELLILLATSFLDRMLPRERDIEPHNVAALNRVFPTPRWQDIWSQRRDQSITAEEGRAAYAGLYSEWLREHM